MKATELFSQLLEKAGYDVQDDKLKDFFLKGIDIPDDVATEINTKLMTIEAAKPLLKNNIISDFSKGWMQNVNAELESHGIEKSEIDAVFKENGKERATGKIIIEAMKKVAEIKDKANVSGSDKEKALREELKTLNASIADYKEKFVPKTDVDNIRNEWNNEKYERAIEGNFLSKKWSDNYPADVRATLSKTFLDKKLNELGAKAVMVGNEVKIVKADDLASDYFDKSNKLVTFASLADEIMSVNKFLAVSPEGGQSTQQTVIANNSGVSNLNKKLNPTLSLLQKSLQAQQE